MSDDVSNHRALLPAGLRDLLPPDAETEAASVEALMEVFAAHGYQRVKPPLLEFEDSLLAGSGVAVAEQTFRLMDPESQRMMGLRADTTPQVARIATTRLAHAPRPLRLSYAGQCLRVRGSQLAPDRQIAQAGIELIGCDNPAADAEIVLVGAEALASVGLTRTSFDFTLPTLVPDAAGRCGVHRADPGCTGAGARPQGCRVGGSPRRQPRADADRSAAGRGAGGPCAAGAASGQPAAGGARPGHPACGGDRGDPRPLAGPAADRRSGGVPRLPLRDRRLGHDLRARAGTRNWAAAGAISAARPSRPPVSPCIPMRCCVPRRRARRRLRLYVPLGADQDEAARMRRLGYATIAALGPEDDTAAEARRLSCSHILRNGSAVKLTGS